MSTTESSDFTVAGFKGYIKCITTLKSRLLLLTLCLLVVLDPYLCSMALELATEREAMALTASASSESPRLASSTESPSRGE